MQSALLRSALWALAWAIPGAATAQPLLNDNRWAEDWRDDGPAYKHVAVAPGVFVDFGADARLRTEMIHGRRFGLSGPADDTWRSTRLMGHANVKLGADLRIFVQTGYTHAPGKKTKGANDQSGLDLQQGFADLSADIGGGRATLRIGRQEMPLGGGRLFDNADSNNVRLRHDAFDLTYRRGPWRFDAFAGAPVANGPDTFDDDAIHAESFHGAVLERRIGGFAARALFIDYARENLSIGGVTANDRRQTVALQFKGAAGAYDLDLELVAQGGAFGDEGARAFGAAADIARRFPEAPWRPRLGARFTFGSGDDDPDDGVQASYAPPFARSSWFNPSFTSFTNVVEPAIALQLNPRENVTLNMRASGLWRAATDDFVYVAPSIALPGTRGGDAFVGSMFYGVLAWRPTPNVTVQTITVAINAGERLQALGGEDSLYANLALLLRY